MKEHDPEWSILVSVIILLACSISFALIAEKMVDEIQPILEQTKLSQSFLGTFDLIRFV
jgi:Ca2+/H+ antiporter